MDIVIGSLHGDIASWVELVYFGDSLSLLVIKYLVELEYNKSNLIFEAATERTQKGSHSVRRMVT
jgi:hypothetical protein